MEHEKFQIYTLKINTITWHCKKKNIPITLEEGCITKYIGNIMQLLVNIRNCTGQRIELNATPNSMSI